MALRRSQALLFIFCLMLPGLTSCVVRRRLITRKGARSSQPLLVANKETLLKRITSQYEVVHDFSATVDMVPALGSVEKSKITEYKDVRAYILFRKPADIRIVGLYPVVRNRAFDMVSTGPSFQLYIPAKNRFITGRNDLIQPATNKIENLRPQHFLNAMLVRPPGPDEKAVLENYTDEDNADYILHLIRAQPDGDLRLARTIWFSRLNLMLSRQIIFDDAGNILTDARYRNWQTYDGVPFPKQMDINRPRDEYAVVITIVKMDINKGVGEDKFVLQRPEGSTLQVLGEKPATGPASAPAAQRKKR